MDVREEAYEKSVKLLHQLSTESGFTASVKDVANYKRVWARDGVVAGLAALLSEDKDLEATFYKTLITLQDNQDETGRIPSNVSISDGKISYGTTVGRVDATVWYVIGVCKYALVTKDNSVFGQFKESVEKALFYLKCLELNGRGLLYIPQGGDWADEYINHGYVLFDEMLYYFALSLYGLLTGDTKIIEKKDFLSELIKVNYLPKKEYSDDPHIYDKQLFEKALTERKSVSPVTYFTNHSVRFHSDVFATALLLHSSIPTPDEKKEIAENIFKLQKPDFPILPAFDPVIKEGDDNFEHLKSNHLYGFKNKPYEYHNGGLWTLVHGFFLSSVDVKDREKHLKEFAQVLKDGEYTFPEYFNGKDYKPMGTDCLGFSAAAYIIAYKSGGDKISQKVFL
ncbi:MAG: hypothetical protein COV70_01430 [Parcubacteria group bacterium CG11_big_fil_rev_8_21_14_0_20_39_22]|nr:MAG: hypothetical protein COV70_01430 [Parcubacteria group bacterium CG11_big_fil_rev_8_21_14_0_20_39_22]